MVTKPVLSIEEFRQEVARNSAKPHKYHACGVFDQGVWFASKREHARFQELKREEAMGIITDLRFQVTFEFFVGHFRISAWRIDFTYKEIGKKIAEDPTGYMAKAKKRNIKLFHEQYPEWELRIT